MSSILDQRLIPLWAVIVVIAVGSVLILAAVVTTLRCLYVRRRRKESNSVVIPDAPTRKVTIRRGRVVSSANHISLTGSAFGALDEDVEAAEVGPARARSRSPFEWWATIKERSQSRQGEMTQTSTGSITSTLAEHPGSPGLAFPSPSERLYPDTPAPVLPANSTLIQHPKPSSHVPSVHIRPSRNINFSRNLTALHQTEFPSSPSTRALESLAEEDDEEEGTPAHLTEDPEKSSFVVETKEIPEVPSIRSHIPTPPPLSPFNYSHSFLSSTSSVSLPTAKLSPSSLVRSSPEAVRSSPNLPSRSHLRHMARRSSSSISESSLTYRQPDQPSRRSSTNEAPQKELRLSRSVEDLRKSETEYWNSRTDVATVRRPSKKGKVLRKKSLQRAARISMVQ